MLYNILKHLFWIIIYQVTEIISEIRAPIVTVGVNNDPADARKKELKVTLLN